MEKVYKRHMHDHTCENWKKRMSMFSEPVLGLVLGLKIFGVQERKNAIRFLAAHALYKAMCRDANAARRCILLSHSDTPPHTPVSVSSSWLKPCFYPLCKRQRITTKHPS